MTLAISRRPANFVGVASYKARSDGLDLPVHGDQKDEAAAEQNDEPHDGRAKGCENLSP